MADTGWRDQSPTRRSAAQKDKQLRERGAFGRGNMRYHFVSAVSSAAMAAAAMTFATSAFAQDGDAGSMATGQRSEEHTSELQSLMRISYAVFCLQKKKNIPSNRTLVQHQQ